ncbi:aspartate aminotransferase family protein [Lentilitoribacter sp. Alg239-R112]|uniref:aspartate aminotransferase family protein n=1 Tax=Lentilitoribacter sp. Alg239-R112 TaxID=2305987 RepID=UPI0013A6AEFC|nr:aspartate aminotransferase family protein [Lentilitoribacter sp. Alg239-R112]
MASATSTFSVFNHPETKFVSGDGVWLKTDKDEKYLDFTAGIAVNSLGHCHPHLVEALKSQAEQLWHISNLYQIDGQVKLADRLVENTFADKVFFTNSGLEAMECAIKTARRYHFAKGDVDKYEIITFEGAFHGRSIATVAAGGQEKYIEGFGPKAPGFNQVPLNDIEALRNAMSERTAALLIEPIQGEGGIRSVSNQFLTEMRNLCDEFRALLIFDEIQCGIGRTGKLFAHEWSGITPDIMAVAKGIGGGFPLGACLATEEAAGAMVPGTHGTTFGGNPLAMSVGNAVLDVVLEDGFLDNVITTANILKQGLAELSDTYPDVIEDIRGSGLMIGIQCKIPNLDLLAAMGGQKLLAVPAGDNVVRLLPPLTITPEEARDGLTRLRQALATF